MDACQVIQPEGYLLSYGGVLGSRVKFKLLRPMYTYIGPQMAQGVLLYEGCLLSFEVDDCESVSFTPIAGEKLAHGLVYSDDRWGILDKYVQLALLHNSLMDDPAHGKQLGKIIAHDRAALEEELLEEEAEKSHFLLCYLS